MLRILIGSVFCDHQETIASASAISILRPPSYKKNSRQNDSRPPERRAVEGRVILLGT
jgi:hypothetical protein